MRFSNGMVWGISPKKVIFLLILIGDFERFKLHFFESSSFEKGEQIFKLSKTL